MTRVTEAIINNTRKFVCSRFGDQAWEVVLVKLSPRTRVYYDHGSNPRGWIEWSVMLDLLTAVAGALSSRDPNVMHQLGLYNAEANLRLTQKLMLKVLTIKMVMKIGAALWSGRIKDGGLFVVINRGPRAVMVRIDNPPAVSDLWWRYLAGWFERSIELAGGKNVSSEWTGGGDKPGVDATFEVTWR